MRIRKRFPLPSLSSLPLSDPQLNRSLVVQQQLKEGNTSSQPSDSPNQPPPPPSNQHPIIASAKELEVEEAREKRLEEIEETNDTRKGNILSAEVGSGLLQATGSSHQIVPPKKRKEFGAILERDKKMKAKMKSKMNKKCVQPNGEEQGSKPIREGDNGNNDDGAKRAKRGNVIMEGSRCSRVNGRGWRCCQQTLVGYSLCEHHLGKGRLRSMASVRNRAMTYTATSAPKNGDFEKLSTSKEKLGRRLVVDDDDDDGDEKKPLMVTKKRKKLGIVKARSISSLLNQTSNALVVAENDKNSSV